MPKGSIVWISDSEDPHFKLVRPHLKEAPIVLDAVRRPMSLSLGGGAQSATHYDRRALVDVRSAWWRRPFQAVEPMVDAHVVAPADSDFAVGAVREYSVGAIREFISLLQGAFPNALWVSDPHAIRRAENKALQLEIAAKVGFPVPETLITSDPEAAQAFLESRPATIIKMLCRPFVAHGGGRFMAFYATRVHGSEHVSLDGLKWAPSIFQQAVDAVYEWRVTVVGEQVFAARIDSEPATIGRPGLRDWRYHVNERGRRFRADTLPGDMHDACLRLTRSFGLQFSAIDLAVDRDGTILFLEINPNGQWGFVEENTGQAIGLAVADLLACG
jgi:glutathione synthase/RimK-type ligase-like ATP-grasp enzyme